MSLKLSAVGHLGPSTSAPEPATLQAHDLTTNQGDVNVAGRDVHIHKYFHSHPSRVDIVAALEAVRNLRNIHLCILSKVTPGTGVWLLKTEKFLVWLDRNGNLKILWGYGIPGAGKTVLASIVIRELEALAAVQGSQICVCYAYMRYTDRADLSVRDILEVFVKQTVERHPDCALLAEQAYARHLCEQTQLTEAELLQLLHQFTEVVAAIFYVLDALDEAPDRIQVDLINKLASLNVRLFITSRPLEAVQSQVSGVQSHCFPIVAQEDDLDLHIAQEIGRSRDLQALLQRAGPTLREEIVSVVKSKCGGMFLHASLQLDAICECVTALEVSNSLEAFPSRIEDVYRQTWDRILEQKPNRVLLAQAALVWVLNASRSMTIEELECAVATNPDTFEFEPNRQAPGATLIALCHGLLMIEPESRLVRLVHYTAKDTLRGLLRDSFPHPHSHLATVCMTHLARCGFQNTKMRSKEVFNADLEADHLLAYASDAWATHARESLHLEDIRRRTADFVSQSNAFPTFTSPALFDILGPLHILAIYNLPFSLMTPNNISNPNVATLLYQLPPLTLASWHGHEGAAVSLLSHPDIQVNLVDSNMWPALILDADYWRGAHVDIQADLVGNGGWSPLMLAAGNGHERIVTLLLARPEIQVNLVSYNGRKSALMLAATNGCRGIVALLLARAEIQVNLVDNSGRSALMLATEHGHEDIVKLLLASPEIQVNLPDNKGCSAIILAARKGHDGIITLLLAHIQIQVNLSDNDGWSPLMTAARYGHEGAVTLLLEHSEVQVNLVDDHGWSALMLGARCGHIGVVASLLAYPAIRINLVDEEGWSALMKAGGNGRKGIVELLLACPRIQVNLIDKQRRSALMLTASHGCDTIAKLLLARSDTQVNLVDERQRSALMLAARHGHESVAKALLARADIQVNLVDTAGCSALAQAARNGYEHILKALLAHPRIKINLVANGGWTALLWASVLGHEGIVRLLLAHPDIQMNVTDGNQWSALMLAVKRGHESIIKLLLKCRDVQLNMVERDGWSSLMLAARGNQEGIVTLLLAHRGIQVNLVNHKGWSSLLLAASNGHEGISTLLFARPEIQANCVCNEGWSPLMMAASNGWEGIVTLLVARSDILVNLVNNNGRSALALAAGNGHQGIVKLLISRPDIQVNLVDSGRRSALMLAARRGHVSIIKLLLTHPETQVDLVDEDGWSAFMKALRYDHEDIVQLLLAHLEKPPSRTSTPRPPTRSISTQVGLDLRSSPPSICSSDASFPSITAAGSDGESSGNGGMGDGGANDQRAESESSGSKRGSKRSRSNGEDESQGLSNDMTAPSAKRRCGVPVIAGGS